MCHKLNEIMNLCGFYNYLNDDFRKEVSLICAFNIDQAYIIVQDYELFIKSRWTKHQDLFRTFFRSQFINNNLLLGAPPYRFSSSSA
jgi:hypothetical protein